MQSNYINNCFLKKTFLRTDPFVVLMLRRSRFVCSGQTETDRDWMMTMMMLW